MITCSECGCENHIDTGYCIICGSRLFSDKSTKLSRLLFFTTPFFIISIFTAFLAELGSADPLAAGISIGGDFAIIYLVVGTCFWLTMRIFRLKSNLADSWLAGIFTVVQLILCSLLIYIITAKDSSSLQSLDILRLKWLAIIFLPSLFTGLLTIVIRAKISHIKLSKGGLIILKNSLVIITLVTASVALGIFYMKPAEEKSYIEAKLISDFGASKLSMEIANSSLEEFPNSGRLYCLKGELLLRDSSLEDFSPVNCFKKAVNIDSKNSDYLLKLSLAFDLENNKTEAIKYAKTAATTVGSSSAEVWKFLGNLQAKYYENEEAVTSFKKALKLQPNNPMLMNNLSFTLLETNKELPLALELAEQSVKKLPGYLFNLDTLAWAYYKNNDFNKALEVMNLIHSIPDELTSEIEFHYAMILYKLNLLKKPDEALNKLMQKTDVLTNHLLRKQISDELLKIKNKLTK